MTKKKVNSNLFFFPRSSSRIIYFKNGLATNIDKPNRDSKIECPALEGLSIAFLCKEFPSHSSHSVIQDVMLLSYGAQEHRCPAGVGGKYLHKQRDRLPEPEHSILHLY